MPNQATTPLIDTSIIATGGPSNLVITPAGRRAYGLFGGGCSVGVLDLVTQETVGVPIVVGFNPSAMAITPDGKRGYVMWGAGRGEKKQAAQGGAKKCEEPDTTGRRAFG